MKASLPYAVSTCANQTLDALRQLTGKKFLAGMDGGDLLCERAILMNLQPQAQVSANGHCYLLHCFDGWIALNLARMSDWQLLPALFNTDKLVTTIEQIKTHLQTCHVFEIVERGTLLGLPIAEAKNSHNREDHWFEIILRGPARKNHGEQPRVLDLSSLWAGPLCSRLLQLTGASVIKVESTQRPDGMRLNTEPGARAFYERLNQNKELLQLDFKKPQHINQLKQLIAQADIVIEGSRPRALQQLGIDAEYCVAQQPGLVWVSITAYGRREPQANRVAFGDDAAVSGGLFSAANSQPTFIGDAIADPLTGLHAALAAFTCWQKGDAVLLDVNLYTVASHAARFGQ